MNRRFFVSALAAGASSSLFGQTRTNRQVIIISIDGLPAYALHDTNVPLPTIHRLAREGATATEGMQVVNPAVTWPNHTAMVTGVTPAKHGVLYNGMPVRTGDGKPLRVDPWVPKDELVLAPTVYDLAHGAGLTTAEVDWVAIHKPKTITWSFAERPQVDDQVVKDMMSAGMVTEAEIRDFTKTQIVSRDEIWTEAGIHILKKHKPNLLLLHLLATDSNQHLYGAKSLGGNTALALADSRIKRIVEAASGRANIFIVSDHGFKTYDKVIHANALLAAKGWLDDAWVIPEGGSAMVYITRSSKKTELAPQLREAFAAVKGVREVVEPANFSQWGFPAPNERMADLVLFAEDRYAFASETKGEVVTDVRPGSTPGAHGYASSDPAMNATFVASGPGIKRGVKLASIRNLDVAPTVARLLGLEMKDIDGRVLTEILA